MPVSIHSKDPKIKWGFDICFLSNDPVINLDLEKPQKTPKPQINLKHRATLSSHLCDDSNQEKKGLNRQVLFAGDTDGGGREKPRVSVCVCVCVLFAGDPDGGGREKPRVWVSECVCVCVCVCKRLGGEGRKNTITPQWINSSDVTIATTSN